MDIIRQIENMTADEIKEQGDELLEKLKDADDLDIESRYLQARHDAKMRDEKLKEQGVTIVALQEALESAKDLIKKGEAEKEDVFKKYEDLIKTNQQLIETADRIKSEHDAQFADLKANYDGQVMDLSSAIKTLNGRCDRLSKQATRNNQALSGAAKLLNDALSAQSVESANQQ
jgi:uncharacterized protein YoxC